MTSIYRTILKNAWQLIWKVKFLWFFGLFAALLGNGGELNLFINNFNFVKNESLMLGTLDSWRQAGGRFGFYFKDLFANFNLILAVIFIISILIIIFLIWLVIISKAGLVSGVYKYNKKRLVDFHDSFSLGKEKFWPVFALNLIDKILVYILLIILGAPLAFSYLNNASHLAQTLLIVLSFIILIPLAVIISLVIRYAIIFCVVKSHSVGPSIKHAWDLFKKNWIVSIEIAIILFFINFLVGLAALIFFIIIAIPFLLLGYAFFALSLQVALSVLVVIGIIFVIAVLLFIGALLSTFQTSVWVMLYTRLSEGRVYPKVARTAAWLAVKMRKGGEEGV